MKHLVQLHLPCQLWDIPYVLADFMVQSRNGVVCSPVKPMSNVLSVGCVNFEDIFLFYFIPSGYSNAISERQTTPYTPQWDITVFDFVRPWLVLRNPSGLARHPAFMN